MSGFFLTQGHLGGFVTGGDPDTTYPKLWDWLVSCFDVKTVLDVGCGDGGAMAYFAEQTPAKTVVGIDGFEPPAHEGIICHDFTTGGYEFGQFFDLVWSAEFVEHVEEAYLGNFLPALAAGRVLAMTHAVPGQGGWHHVNCRDSEYWIEQLDGYGMAYSPELTEAARMWARKSDVVNNYFDMSGMIFLNQLVYP